MIISKISCWVLFRANFLSSALIEKEDRNSWGANFILSTSSDEDPPVVMNGHFIGGGHGEPCCVSVYAPSHGKTLKDVGAVYKDDEGTKFTIIFIHNEDYVRVVSENIGESTLNYRFKMNVSGKLTYLSNGENKDDIVPLEQISPDFLYSANRMLRKKVVGYKDGKAKTILTSMECDYAEMIEEYDIINPATVAPILTAERPEGGYKHTPDMSLIGEPMLKIKYIFRINPDGTILVDFDVTKLMDVRFDRFIGVMYQEKRDVFGGGIHRYLSKLKPFTTPEGTFDYSSPLPLRGGAYPESYSPSKDDFINPDDPFDRIVDYFRDKDGVDKLGFACGYLPVYDGEKEKRKDLLHYAIHIYKTRKAYPNFATAINVNHFHGCAYKKFFDTENRASVYAMEYEGKKYIYFDFFENNTLTYPVSGKVSLYEADGVEYQIKDGAITASGSKGHATFIEGV